jgi:hypothetical protein
MKKSFLNLVCFATALLLAGCRTTIDNLTPIQLPKNSSHIYTMTMAVHIPSRDVVQQSLRPFIIIDGKRRPMKRSDFGRNIFVYDYRFPEQRNKVHYYYELEYDSSSGHEPVTKIERSQLFEFQISGRCVLSLDVYRGIPGTKVVLLGRGFQNDDRVIFEDKLAKTRVHSDHMIKFIVPCIEAEKNYHVTLQGSQGTLLLGDFFVDLAPIYASKESLHLHGKERQSIVFSVDYPVPTNGLMLDVTTDIPEDVVMPELMIPSEARSVESLISGNGYEASGHLFVEAKGYQSLTIPLGISGKAKEAPANTAVVDNFSEEENAFSSEMDNYTENDDIIVIE